MREKVRQFLMIRVGDKIMKWVEFTHILDGKKMLVNIDKIEKVFADDEDNTILVFESKNSAVIIEKYADVITIIREKGKYLNE